MGGPKKTERETCEHCHYKAYPAAVMAVLPGLPMIVQMSATLRYIMARFGT